MSTTMNLRILAAAVLFTASAPALAAGDAAAGQKKSVPCKACHGEAGVSVSPEFPIIAGQPQDYLAAALSHYKNGKRKNPIMQAQVANLTPRDMQDLAAFYAKQRGLPVHKY
jgi:cytochrome c553